MTNKSKTSSSAIDSYPLCLLHSSIIPTEHRPSNSQLQLRETKTIATRRDQTKTIPSQARCFWQPDLAPPWPSDLAPPMSSNPFLHPADKPNSQCDASLSRDGQSRFIAPAGLVCLRARACQGASPADAAHLRCDLDIHALGAGRAPPRFE
jgi:hypothetical protein